MTNTTSTYLSIENNLARYQKLEARQPAVKTATAYYNANIGKVTIVNQLVGNYRLLSYALQAYGLGDQINNKALIKQVLTQGTTNPRALANTLPNGNWKKFAFAFNFSATGSASPASASSVSTTTGNYVEQQLETAQGASNPGVQLALYFQRVAPTITNSYGILGDQNLLETVQTIFNLPSTANAAQIDKEAVAISKLAPVADLRNPVKLKQLVERFTASYDAAYGPNSGATSSLTVTNGNMPSTLSAAASVLSGIVSSNATSLSSLTSYSPYFSASFLSSLALGG
jgi:hypothetical protein